MGNKVALPFLLENVTSPETGISVKTYALLDSGSNVSLCQDKLLHLLKARGRTERMSLTTLEKENNKTTAQVISLRISNLDGSDEITIPQVFARPNLRLSSSNLVTEAEVRKWPHLKDLPLHHAEIDDVALLIGQDCPEALMPLTTIPGGKGELYAVRTRLGWSVSGPVSNSMVKLPSTSHYISNESLLQEKVERSWQLESTNRVAEIQDTMNAKEWRHVPFQKNPADDASRGVPASSLMKSRWLHGPDFLQLPPDRWPSASAVRPINEDDPKVKKAATFATRIVTPQNPVDKLIVGISNWTRLIRILACFALIPEVHRRKTPFTGSLEAEHLQRAEENLVRYIQNQCYPEEIKAATQGRPIPSSSPLKRLPVLHDGVLVVPGRLAQAKLPSQAKRPVILRSRHPVIESLVRHVHERTAHSGRGYVLSELRRKYWIVGATPLVKKVIKHCVACRRRDARPCCQLEANLPLDRITPYEPAFTCVGVDYFGPFAVKRGRGREKRYGCIFTCLTTRAVHIETADTLDTDSFINCLYRFMARRGEPRLLHSDNGTNFVGAERELRKEMEAWNKDRIQEAMSQRGIRWLFNPPAASHMGGVWERQIRSVRRILFTIMTEQVPTSEMLTTLLVVAEGIINNRPLTPASDDPNDLEPLTPNHLLIHRPASAPPGLFNENDLHSRKKWRQVQYLADVFWKRWTREYLLTLRQRTKWHQPRRNVQENDLVLIIDKQRPRNSWPVGRVIETYKGTDDLVRSARVRLRDTELVRPIAKLCILEEALENAQDDG